MNHGLIDRIRQELNQKHNIILSGLAGAGKAFFLCQLIKQHPGKCLCLVPEEERAHDLAQQLRAYADNHRINFFLGRDFAFIKENYSPAEGSRISILQQCLLHPRRSDVIVANPAGLLYPIITPQFMRDSTITINQGAEASLEFLISAMVRSGYRRVGSVVQPGEMAVRGGLLDVFPVGDQLPCRIEFFGDTVDSIRRFYPDSQRSEKGDPRIHIPPADELNGPLEATLFDYLPEQGIVFMDEPREFMKQYDGVLRRYRETLREARHHQQTVRELPVIQQGEIRDLIAKRPAVYHSFFPGNIAQVSAGMLQHITQQDMEPFYGDVHKLEARIKEWDSRDYEILLAVKSKTARERLIEEFQDHHVPPVQFTDRPVAAGFINPDLKVVMVAEKDIWGRVKSRKSPRKTRQANDHILLEEIKSGDYIVHEHYGIGIFRGITQVEQHGATKEYILLQYAGTDRLYLPVEKLDVLYKYHASEEKNPRLSKLGGTEWERTKARVAQSIQEMAEKLLVLYASRQARQGFAFSADTPWQQQFEDDFPYQETPDQARAILDVKKDMENPRPMDRLICGDVGYGKTEVAMRAAFKAVMDGKQVAVLVPTTVLAEQHYHSFKERFQKFPAAIEVLSRFRSAAEQRRIITDLNKGIIDIVIGTHRMLSKDIAFKDLGLLVIDEEHRFGVAQKEKIKMFKELVDVLSLSATPIPRSLHMSLTGLRDLTVIETAPPGRYPITTYVMEYREDIIHEAIRYEVERNGQVFVVHNRIEGIERVKAQLEKVLPNASIVIGHGRMHENELARIMSDFIQGRHQILLCTTIIESGLDMPNVNTIIVDEADKMGLAQLYQLRGRVGRSHRIAYAYLTYQPERVLNENAQKRLNAIREFNELGAGMKIALRDLEIRGAGNILGPEQHGYIQAVGFDMYCRLLEQETARLRGHIEVRPSAPMLDVDVDYYIPDNYIADSGTKIRMYRRLLLAQSQAEVDEIRAEMEDRFGKPPRPVENFIQITLLRLLARDKEIKLLRRKGKQIEIQLNRDIPPELFLPGKEFQVKRVNRHTLLVQPEGDALQVLQGVLSAI